MAPTSAVIVTGGASGIGRACAEAVAAQGRAVAVWDLKSDGALGVAQEIANKHNVATFGLGIDVTKTAELASAVDASRSAVGPLGGLVHAAGTVRSQSVGDLDDAGWDFVLNVNLRAFPMLVQAMHSDLAAADGAAVVPSLNFEDTVIIQVPISIPRFEWSDYSNTS